MAVMWFLRATTKDKLCGLDAPEVLEVCKARHLTHHLDLFLPIPTFRSYVELSLVSIP